jgi:hypothetical protein
LTVRRMPTWGSRVFGAKEEGLRLFGEELLGLGVE